MCYLATAMGNFLGRGLVVRSKILALPAVEKYHQRGKSISRQHNSTTNMTVASPQFTWPTTIESMRQHAMFDMQCQCAIAIPQWGYVIEM